MTAFVPKSTVLHLGTDPVPVESYISPAYFERERDAIFKRVWLFVCREIDLPAPGNYLVKEIPVGNASVVVVRDESGSLNAFHNVCSHRHARIANKVSGTTTRFTCPYHGWGYSLNGDLTIVPDQVNFFALDKKACGLTRVALDVSNGFVFINLDRNPRQSLREFLNGLDDRLATHALASCSSSYQFSCEIPVNWKCIVDNFQETYHLKFAHAYSLHDRAIGPGNPLGHPLSFEFFGPHRVMGVWGNLQHKQSLVEGIAARSGALVSQGATSANKPASRHPNWQMDMHAVFPNIIIDVSMGLFLINEVMPVSVDRSWWSTTVYYPEARTAAERFSQEYSAAALRDTVAEDLSLLSNLQAGMRSGAKTHLQFQSSEALCRHLHRTVDEYVRARQAC